MSSVQCHSCLVTGMMGIRKETYGLMVNHGSLELPPQEGLWTWYICFIKLSISLSFFSSFFPPSLSFLLSLQHSDLRKHLSRNIQSFTFVWPLYVYKLPRRGHVATYFFSCLMKHFSKCGQWSPWGQKYFYYNTKKVQSYNSVSVCWHLH